MQSLYCASVHVYCAVFWIKITTHLLVIAQPLNLKEKCDAACSTKALGAADLAGRSAKTTARTDPVSTRLPKHL